MPSDDAPTPVPQEPPHPDPELRLHPFSWLFVLLTQLRQYIVPLLVVTFVGRGSGWELWGMLGGVFVALYALVYSFGFRYRLGADELVVREGIFVRTERHVPYARIQNVVQQRNALHRAFGVTELHLESASGGKPEAVMNVITLDAAARIEAMLAGGRGGATAAVDDPMVPPLVALDTGEVLKLGLMTNRGAVVVGALFAAFYQFEPWESRRIGPVFADLEAAIRFFFEAFPGPVAFVAAALLAVIAFVVVMKILSIAMALLSFHGFTLHADRERASTGSGLITRRTATARLDKIQRVGIRETWIARRLGRRSLECDVATGRAEAGQEKRERFRWLAPVATPATVAWVLRELVPDIDTTRLAWRPLHPRAGARMFKRTALFATLGMLPAVVLFREYALIVWAVVILHAFIDARRSAAFAGYWFDGRVFACRSGWLLRRWSFARVGKGQVVALAQSPFDRRARMATVQLDTAGAGQSSYSLEVPYLPEDEARALFDEVSRAVATLSTDADSGTDVVAEASPLPAPDAAI